MEEMGLPAGEDQKFGRMSEPARRSFLRAGEFAPEFLGEPKQATISVIAFWSKLFFDL